MTGTFSGKLTAQAIDVVENVTIRGESIAKTLWSYVSGPKLLKAGQSFEDTLITSLDLELGEFESGYVLVTLQYTAMPPFTYNTQYGAADVHVWMVIYVNDVQYNVAIVNGNQLAAWKLHALMNPCFSEFIFPVSPGGNFIELRATVKSNYSNALTYIKNITFRAEFVRKV